MAVITWHFWRSDGRWSSGYGARAIVETLATVAGTYRICVRTMEAEDLPSDAILAGVVPRLTETGLEEFTVKRASDEAQAH